MDGNRPKYLNDYLFDGFKIEPPPGLMPKVAAALDAEQEEDIRLESARTQRDALLKRVLIDMDPSLFPAADNHHYVYHPSEARPNPFFDEFFENMYPDRAAHARRNAKTVAEGGEAALVLRRRDGRQTLAEDPREYRTPEPGENVVCYNCGKVDAHFGSWCPFGQRPVCERVVHMIDPVFAARTGLLDELKARQRHRHERRRAYSEDFLRVDAQCNGTLSAFIKVLYVDCGGSEAEAAKLRIRWNSLAGRLEWYQKKQKKWEPVPKEQEPVSAAVLSEGKDQTGGVGGYSKFAEGGRAGQGEDEEETAETEPEPAEQGRGEGVEEPVGMQEDVQMRVIFASHSDSEDDYRYLCPAPPPETEAGADHGGGG